MFHSQSLVSRKGPLGAIWVAAYFVKKLKKAQVNDTHIPSSVDQILQKELDVLTYRVLAYLLLGVVRIYSKKVDFLFHDCNRALTGVKEFVAKEKNREHTNVALPAASTGFLSITLPKSFELDAFDLGVLEDFHGGNVKPQEDITLKEGGGAGRDTESMDQYYMERFDTEEDLLSTFHETFVADQTYTRHESSAHDMDIDAENDRYASGETSVRVIETDPLNSNNSSRDHQTTSRHGEEPESDDMLVEPQVSEDIIRAQEKAAAGETICTIAQRLEDPESDDMLVELQASEDIRRAQEEETVREDPLESPGGNLHRDRQRENSESEKTSVETSWEKTPHDGSLPSECKSPEEIHVSEDQPSGASRTDGEKEIPEMSTREEEPEPGCVSENRDFPEGIEKHRGHNDEEMTDTDMFLESHKEPSDTPEVNQAGHSVTGKGFLSDVTSSEESSKETNAKDTPVAATPKPASWLNISEGETSHQLSIIPTPAGKESSRVSRKRKCIIDDEVMIPSKVMKKMIEDPSTLVAKRRRVPHTDYHPEKRIKRFTDPSKCSWDPLIPYGSLDLQSLFCQPIKLKEQNITETPKAAKTARRMTRSSLRTVGDASSSAQTENGPKIMETPQAAALIELKITVPETVENNNTEVSAETGASSSIAAGSFHPTNVPPETPAKPAEPTHLAPETPARTSEQTGIAPETPVVSERVEIAPDTPVRESTSKRYFEDPEICEQETRPANSFTSFDERPSEPPCEVRRDLDAVLMNEEEVNADEKEDLQQETWSARTSSVAKFLEKTFLEQREKGEEEKASLLQLCIGRTQKESARLFYETLVLKTKGYLEVKQDHPYSDILLSRFTRQQEAC